MFQALLIELFVLLSRLDTEEQPETRDQADIDINQTRINTVKAFIEEHYASDLKIADIARCASLAPQYLCRVFKKVTGMPLVSFINLKRLQIAKELLRTTELKVSAVSSEAGFNDLSHFNRVFKSELDMSPLRYRRLSRQ